MLAIPTGCYRYRPEVLTSLQTGQVGAGARVRLTYRDHRRRAVEMDLERLEPPYVSGIVYTRGGAPGDRIAHHVRVDLAEIEAIEVEELDGAASTILVVGVLATVVAVVVVGLTSPLPLSGYGSRSP